MRVLVTGAGGMLGADVLAAAGADGVGLTRGELDITDPDAVASAVERIRPDAVVNCAAFTDVDGAESAEDVALAVNGEGAGHLARGAAASGAWLVHVSTDYVFDGRGGAAYVESSPVGPLSAYGRTKLAGEQAVAREAPVSHTIVRASWLFGVHGRCFPATIMRAARERGELTVVDDQVGCPTFTGHLADALLKLAAARVVGLAHVAGGGECSWFQFARAIVAEAGIDCSVTPGRTADLARPAPRPAYSVLRTERPDVPKLPDWGAGLGEYLSQVVVRA